MISKEKKTAIMNEYARTPGDTGSPEVSCINREAWLKKIMLTGERGLPITSALRFSCFSLHPYAR